MVSQEVYKLSWKYLDYVLYTIRKHSALVGILNQVTDPHETGCIVSKDHHKINKFGISFIVAGEKYGDILTTC